MADYNTTRDTSPKKDKGGILKTAREQWDRALDRERDNITKAYADLEFLSGDELSQWPEKQRKQREAEGRPVLQVNRLPQFVHQVTGDIRQMKPSIHVVPVDSESDPKTADIIGGLIRYIENRSDAQAIYFRAADSQVACGIGHWRVVTEYADATTFNQEIRVAPVDDQVSVLWDPDSVLPSKEDAQYCFVPVDMTVAAFKERYPGVTPSQFDDENWSNNREWVTDDYVRVAEYWVKKPSRRMLALLPTGELADITDAEPDVLAFYQSKQARIEERDSYKVCRYLISASDVLEGPDEWMGRHIPIVPAVGEEIRVGRKLIRKGIVRDATDPQRMVNYFHSAHTEVVALQPKAPFLVTERNVAKYQDTWEQANTKNLPYLPYEPDAQNGGAAPQRVAPPVSSQGILDGLTIAQEDLKAVIGIYDASLGAKSNETSGKAIMARQREGDVGSFHYIDNFARAVRRTGQIIVDLIPHVYDSERTIRIMGEDGRVDLLEINKTAGLGPVGETQYKNDITVGSYDVVTTIGPSYTTRREEAREGMTAFLQALPESAPLILDLVAKGQDWPMADEIAKRVRATLPPQILAIEQAEKQGMSPEEAQAAAQQAAQPPPDPNLVKVQAQIEMDQAKMQMDGQKAQSDLALQEAKIAGEQRLAEQKLMAEIALKREEMNARLTLERERFALEADLKRQQAAVDADLRRQDIEQRSKERTAAAKQKKKEAA